MAGRRPLPWVRAWATVNRLTPGPGKAVTQSNEITTILQLLELRDLRSCLVTLDAMGWPKSIARQIAVLYMPPLADRCGVPAKEPGSLGRCEPTALGSGCSLCRRALPGANRPCGRQLVGSAADGFEPTEPGNQPLGGYQGPREKGRLGRRSLAENPGRLKGNCPAQLTNLSRKGYGSKVAGSLDFVVMFVPGDQFLAAALKSDAGLVDYAISQRIALATPATLIAMLWAVNSGWQQYRLTEDAARIKQVGDEMYKRLLTFINHYSRVGKGLESALTAYNGSIGSFDRSVVPQGRRFADLVVGNETEFNLPPPIDELPRQSVYAADDDAADDDTAEPQLAAADN